MKFLILLNLMHKFQTFNKHKKTKKKGDKDYNILVLADIHLKQFKDD